MQFFYIGNYTDVNNNYILKVGITNNPQRRKIQHNYYYRHKAIHNRMELNGEFNYIKFYAMENRQAAIQTENINRERLKLKNNNTFINNDRFMYSEPIKTIKIQIGNKIVTVKNK